jgi:23S rRNA (adenine2503-C2)-methyltransferase
MLAQIALLQKHFIGAGGRVSRIVVMGSGEPLLNYDEVLKFLFIAHEPSVYGIGFRHMTLSTCGIAPGIERLSAECLPVNLSVSLHAPVDELRSRLMPVNDRYRIADVLRAAGLYAARTGRQITYEYILLRGVNDSAGMAVKLAALLRGSLSAVNLIPVNSVKGTLWRRPGKNAIDRFAALLRNHGAAAFIRREMGSDIQAACGQLIAREEDDR